MTATATAPVTSPAAASGHHTLNLDQSHCTEEPSSNRHCNRRPSSHSPPTTTHCDLTAPLPLPLAVSILHRPPLLHHRHRPSSTTSNLQPRLITNPLYHHDTISDALTTRHLPLRRSSLSHRHHEGSFIPSLNSHTLPLSFTPAFFRLATAPNAPLSAASAPPFALWRRHRP